MPLLTDGFDSPVGTLAERAMPDVPPGDWYVTLSFGRWYLLSGKYPAYHPGADIVLIPGGGYGQPIYSIANGIVTFSKDMVGTTWRNLIVIRHENPDGSVICSRYAHLKVRSVNVGDIVKRGQQIGEEGNANAAFAAHLHADLAPGNTLIRSPANWPGNDLAAVRRLYVDIIAYIRGHRPMSVDRIIALAKQIEVEASYLQSTPPPVVTTPMYVVANVTSLRIRSASSGGDTPIVGYLKTGDVVGKTGEEPGWTKILTPIEGYVSSEYLSTTRPNL